MALYEFLKNHIAIGICVMVLLFFIWLMFRRQSYIVAIALTIITAGAGFYINAKLTANPQLAEDFDQFFLDQGNTAVGKVEDKGDFLKARGRKEAEKAKERANF